ncbi:MAG: hypothetical protein WCH01_17890 [Methylococcaceae bacterium]
MMQIVGCVFCSGTGKDPFGIMSWHSSCPVCLGKKVIEVVKAHVPCAHCKGSGAYKTFSCGVCAGKGVVSAPVGPTRICPDCRGTGDDIASGMACLTCRGRGWIMGELAC